MPTIATEGSPNIVVVMNESFSDLTTYLEGYETSTDPMPYVHSLMKRGDVVSGTCAVSSDMGTGTANSEFELLTGNSMAYFKGIPRMFNLSTRKRPAWRHCLLVTAPWPCMPMSVLDTTA